MNIGFLDIILLLVVVFGFFIGYRRGFLIVASKPIKVIASIALTFSFAPFIVSAWSGPYFTEVFYEKIYDYVVNNCPEITASTAAASLPTVLKLVIKVFKVDLSATGGDSGATEAIEAISRELAAPVGDLVAVIVTYILTFILAMILLSLAISLTDKILSAKPLNIVNKTLGVVIGLAFAVVICCIFASLVSFLVKDFSGGAVFDFFKNLNPLEIILSF